MKDRAIELDSKNTRGYNKDGADEHSSCRDILSKGTEAEKHRGGSGKNEQPRLTDVWCAGEEAGLKGQELGLEAECQALRPGYVDWTFRHE